MSKNCKTALCAAGAGLVLSLAARIITIICFTDMKTGFLYHGSEILCNIILYGFAAAAAVAAGIFTRKEPKYVKVSEKGSLAIGIVTLLAAVCAVYEGIMETSALTPNAFLMFLDFAGALYMAILAFITIHKKDFSPGRGFGYSLTGIYCIMRGIYIYMNRMVIAAVPEYLSELIGVLACAFFFMSFGKMFSGNSEKLTRPMLSIWGTGAAVITISTGLGVGLSKLFAPAEISERISVSTKYAEIFYQDQQGADGYIMTFPPFVNIALGFLAMTVVVVSLKCAVAEDPIIQKEKPTEEEPGEQ